MLCPMCKWISYTETEYLQIIVKRIKCVLRSWKIKVVGVFSHATYSKMWMLILMLTLTLNFTIRHSLSVIAIFQPNAVIAFVISLLFFFSFTTQSVICNSTISYCQSQTISKCYKLFNIQFYYSVLKQPSTTINEKHFRFSFEHRK